MSNYLAKSKKTTIDRACFAMTQPPFDTLSMEIVSTLLHPSDFHVLPILLLSVQIIETNSTLLMHFRLQCTAI